MVAADVLGKLRNLQHFASVSSVLIIKGRFQILDPDADRPPSAHAAQRNVIRAPAAIKEQPS